MIDLNNFVLGFVLNMLASVVIARFIYYPTHQRKSYIFTFLALSTVLFFVLSLLTSIEIGVGVGFGLFAIFSIMRYRTDTIPIRDMTYMFIFAALPVMNAAGAGAGAWPQLLAANLAIIVVLVVLEREWGFRFEESKDVVYERIELIRPERQAELLADLAQRTGIRINRVAIGKVDFVRDTAHLRIYFDRPRQCRQLNGAELMLTGDGRSDNDDD